MSGSEAADSTVTRVFLIAPHELVRRGVAELVATAPDLSFVGSAPDVAAAEALLESHPPDVVVLEGRLPNGAGVTACRTLRSHHPEVRCVLLVAFDDDEALVTAVMAGAQTYLLKRVGGLLDGIRAVQAGDALPNEPVTERLLDRLRRVRTRVGASPVDDDEQQLMQQVTRGCTDAQIAAESGLGETEVRARVAAVYAELARRPGRRR